MENIGCYIPPEDIYIKPKASEDNPAPTNFDINPEEKKVTIEFIPLRKVLKNFFELPGVFNRTIAHFIDLENNRVLMTNVIHGSWWESKKALFGEKLVLPIFLYQDDYETRKP